VSALPPETHVCSHLQVQRRRHAQEERGDLGKVDRGRRQQSTQVCEEEVSADWGTRLIYSLQLRILQRGMQILAPGGRLVYSTCSFNPAEDEAVIAAALNEQPGEFSIVDVSADYPELKRRPGMTSWKVATQPAGKDTDLVWHESFQSYRKRADAGDERDKDKMKGIPETVWAPENIAELGMEKASVLQYSRRGND
jgi:multisite-specific tRNA:(cytosine-C5)-methyltransferase